MTLLGTTIVAASDDEFLRARYIREAIEKVRAEVGDIAVGRFAGEDLGTAQVAQGLASDLFGDTPVMVVTDGQKVAKSALDALLAWCAAKNPDALLFVEVVTGGNSKAPKDAVAAFKKAGATVHEVAAPKGKQRVQFASSELRRFGLQADSEAERMLAECEPDLRGISVRAEQLSLDLNAAGTSGRSRVTADHVAAVATSTGAANGFLVADALMTRNPKALAAAIASALETGTPAVLIVSACLGALRDVAAVQSGRPGKMPPWKAQKAQAHARKWSPEALARATVEIGGAHPAIGLSGRRESDLTAALMRSVR